MDKSALVLDENLDKIDKNKETTEYLNVKYVVTLTIWYNVKKEDLPWEMRWGQWRKGWQWW